MHLTDGWDGKPVLSEVEGSIYRVPRSWTFLTSLQCTTVLRLVRFAGCAATRAR
jgi:hypothetical protein